MSEYIWTSFSHFYIILFQIFVKLSCINHAVIILIKPVEFIREVIRGILICGRSLEHLFFGKATVTEKYDYKLIKNKISKWAVGLIKNFARQNKKMLCFKD